MAEGDIWNIALFLALLALLFWILSVTGVLPLGQIAYVLIVIAIVLLIIWLFMRFFGGCAPRRAQPAPAATV